MKLSSLAKDLEPYLIKLIRAIVGQMQFAGIRSTVGLAYRLRLIDQSEREIIEYIVDAAGSGEYISIYDVMVAAGAGDVVLIPAGTFQGPLDTTDGSTPDISFVGQSRAGTIIDGSVSLDGGGGSIEHLSLIDSYNSASGIDHITLYGAGTLHVNDVHVEITQAGSGDVYAVSASDSDAVIHVWNS